MTCKTDNILTLDYISFNRRDFINLCCNYNGWLSTKNIGNKLYDYIVNEYNLTDNNIALNDICVIIKDFVRIKHSDNLFEEYKKFGLNDEDVLQLHRASGIDFINKLTIFADAMQKLVN